MFLEVGALFRSNPVIHSPFSGANTIKAPNIRRRDEVRALRIHRANQRRSRRKHERRETTRLAPRAATSRHTVRIICVAWYGVLHTVPSPSDVNDDHRTLETWKSVYLPDAEIASHLRLSCEMSMLVNECKHRRPEVLPRSEERRGHDPNQRTGRRPSRSNHRTSRGDPRGSRNGRYHHSLLYR